MSEPKPLARPPVDLKGAVGIEIGRALEIEAPKHVIRLRRKPRLYWFPDKKVLAFFVTHKEPKWLRVKGTKSGLEKIEGVKKTAKARRVFENFMGRLVRTGYTLRVPERAVNWYNNGPILRLDYSSDKFGEKREYTHGHGGGVRIYTQWPKKGWAPSLWVIKGGRLAVTARGIVN